MRVLVTGGAGYVGSHTTRLLVNLGWEVTVFDNLCQPRVPVLENCSFVEGDLANEKLLKKTLEVGFDAVVHFAGSICVPESLDKPLSYYENNVGNSLGLLRSVIEAGVERFVFSSTAAVYGIPVSSPIPEAAALSPINPYGASKLMFERMLADAAAASSLEYVALRYFNAAGADPAGGIGEAHEPETHLIPIALQVASGRRSTFFLYGDDYDTPDGTCIRDYIHVNDLASAHVDALRYLANEGSSAVFNCGYGRGYSVQEVLESVRRVTGKDIDVRTAPRRAGDPPSLVADSSLIRETLGWKPAYDDLDLIIETAWKWENELIRRQGGVLTGASGE